MPKDRRRSYKKDDRKEKDDKYKGGYTTYNTIKRGGRRKTCKKYKRRDSRKKYYR
jgi:hypothetical protein